MTETTRLLLIRHAKPSEAVTGRCYGALDVGLSEAGREQARQLADALAEAPLVALYTSPLRRAVETAAPLAARLGHPPTLDERLAELNFGAFEGRSYDEIERSHPELYRDWMETPWRVEFPGGESFPSLRRRALAAMEALRRRHAGATFALVSHGGVLRAMLADCLTMPDAAIFRLRQDHAALSVVDWTNDVPLLRLLNLPPALLGAVGAAQALATVAQ